jgi:PspA associated protein B
VGLRDVLLGRKKLQDPARERLFAITTARITLETDLGLKPAGSAGVCFKSLSSGEFVRAENDLQQLLDAVAGETASKIERKSDDLGWEWLVVRDQDFEELVATVHTIAQEFQDGGFGEQLLAALFPFEGKFKEGRANWIYGFKQGAFWPFVPTGKGQERDNAEELELKAKLEPELPIEQDLTRWFGLFDAPV